MMEKLNRAQKSSILGPQNLETVEGHGTQNHSYCSILYTPTSIPYKAYTGALLY